MNKKLIQLIVICLFLGNLNQLLFAQSHGIPSSIDTLIRTTDFLPNNTNGLRIQTGTYYSLSKKFFKETGDLITPSGYSDYYRLGAWIQAEQKIGDSFLIGCQIPVQLSGADRKKDPYPYQFYKQYIIGDFNVYGGYEIVKTPQYTFFTDLHVIIPAQSKRGSFVDPFIYLGLDGHMGIQPGIAGSFKLKDDLMISTKISYLKTLAKDRIIVEGDHAKSISSGNYTEISANFDPRDVIDLSLVAQYQFSPDIRISIGYERWAETSDTVSNIQVSGDTTLENKIKSMAEGSNGLAEYLLLGINFPFFLNTKGHFNYKLPLAGYYAYQETIYSLSVEQNF